MAVKDFVKTRDGDLDGQEENFIVKLATIRPTLGIDAAEITSVTTILGDHRTSFSAMLAKKAESKAAVADNKLKKNLAIDEFRRIAKKMKASTGYTEAIGDELRHHRSGGRNSTSRGNEAYAESRCQRWCGRNKMG